MPLPEHIFRSYDIRGLLAEVTPEIAYAVGRALVRKTGAECVVVGRDMRATSAELERSAIRGVTSMGARVVDIGLTSTSIFNFATSTLKDAEAGLMVTASHNPAQYNGIKCADGTGLPLSGKSLLEALHADDGATTTPGEVTERDIIGIYVDACVAFAKLPLVRGMKIAVDYGNGMGALALKPLAEKLGLVLTELYAEPDAHFPHHEANPAKRETLKDLTALMKTGDFAFGVALDGDADRIGFLDNKGEPLRGDETLALFAEDELRAHPGATIIVQPNHSWATTDAIVRQGGRAVLRAIGRTKVVEGMRTEHARLGGEVSSHFFFAEFKGLEAVDFAFCRMLGIVAKSGDTLRDLAKPLRKFANSWEVNFEVHDKGAALARVEAAYAGAATKVERLDGLRCEFGRDWWFILRASNTEPLLRLTVEAGTKKLMKEKRDELSGLIRA